MNPILKAARFARNAHRDQKRKYTGRPYVEHPARVAGRVMLHEDASEELVIAAWLHDVIEDTPATAEDLSAEFGDRVAAIVTELTNPSKGSTESRDKRKAMDRAHLATVSHEAKIIKLFDRIDNLGELDRAPESFQHTYRAESRLLCDAIGDADDQLKAELLGLINAS
ncbi:MAG: HD domain-containing protein [Planctomycetota bacterium]